jgi:hypothetical protein
MGLFKKQTTSLAGIDYTSTDLQILDYWIVASRDNNMMRVSTNLLECSLDAGSTWTNSLAFTDYDKIDHAYIYANGNISVFTNDNKIYLTNISLDSINEVIPTTDGTTSYIPHTPSNASYPGAYFNLEAHMSSTNNTNIHVLSPYGNSVAINGGVGASAMTIPMTDDYGVSWRITYEFGQNQVYTDDGTASGSSGGTLLGDSGNSVVCRHMHNVEYNSYNDKFYLNTGDNVWTFTTPDMEENNWFEGTYSSGTISWSRISFTDLDPIPRTHKLKATGMFFVGEYIYWASDANPVTVPDEQGIFRSKISTFSDPTTHETVLQLGTNDVVICMQVDENTGRVLCILLDENDDSLDRLLVANDYGHGSYEIYTVPDNPILLRLNSPNSEGYFRMDFNGFNNAQTKSILIKLGEDLFTNL